MSNTPLLPEEEPFSFNGKAVADSIASMLNEVAQCEGSPERFKGEYNPPTDKEVAECYRRNCTVQGRLYIRPEIDGAWPRVEIPVFHPYHGVFILGNRNGGFERPARAKLKAWHPCLVRRQGLWVIKRSWQSAAHEKKPQDRDRIRRFPTSLQVELAFLNDKNVTWECDLSVQAAKAIEAHVLLRKTFETQARSFFRSLQEGLPSGSEKDDWTLVAKLLRSISDDLFTTSTDTARPDSATPSSDSAQAATDCQSKSEGGTTSAGSPPSQEKDESTSDLLQKIRRIFTKEDFDTVIRAVESRSILEQTQSKGKGKSVLKPVVVLQSFVRRFLLSEDESMTEWQRDHASLAAEVSAMCKRKYKVAPKAKTKAKADGGKLFVVPSQFKIHGTKRYSDFARFPELTELLLNPGKAFEKRSKVESLLESALHDLLCSIDVEGLRDPDNLRTTRLFTYDVFLAENIVEYILNGWAGESSKLAPDYWKESKADGVKIGSVIRNRILSTEQNQYVWLRPFAPRNGADAVSALTELSRHRRKQKSLAQLPIDYHQSDPSFFKRICPVETPESEMIGLTLHLAAGVTLRGDGSLQAATDPAADGLGYVASLIPFYQHTDAARAMVGAKNYVQARPVDGAETPLVQSGMEQRIEKTLQPLIQQGLIPSESSFMHPGRNLLVAYMPYFGYNYNDAVVVSEKLRDSMAFEKREELKLELGDKLMGRHGNKGVVGALLPPDKMPRLPVDPRLGELSGRAVDIVLNPLGVISRMNLGQLLETHVGLLKELGVADLPEDVGKPFKSYDPEVIRERLLAINKGGDPLIDSCGRMTLTIPDSLATDATDMQTTSPVVVGMQYFVRLDQVPSEKANFRGRDSELKNYDLTTGQPVRGKVRGGGQGIGNMEFWALEAYGAETIIKRILTDRFKPMPPAGMDVEGETQSQTFRAVRAFFRVLGVAIEGPDEDDRYQVRWTQDDEIESHAKALKFNPKAEENLRGVRGEIQCHKCGRLFGDKATLPSADGGYRVCAEDLLREHKIDMSKCDYDREVSAETPTKIVQDATIRLRNKSHWELSINGAKYNLYQRTERKKRPTITISDILRMPVTCECSTTTHLVCKSVKARVKVPSFGGLSDPSVFRDSTFSWGFIRLPSPVSAKEVLGGWAAGRGDISVVPILPRRYRQNYWDEDGKAKPHDVTALYEKLAAAAIKPNVTDADLVNAVKGLFTKIREMLHGKDGLVRGKGFKRRLDNSGRFVIVPDPSLAWDECGLPVDVLKKMYPEDTVLAEMSADPTEEDLTGYAPPPDRFVLVNRQPSLHRYSFKALRPVPLRNPGRSGNSRVLAVNPLVCASMGADYDGDEMAVYVLDPGEEDDARKMLPTARQNLLSLANGAPLAGFDQDMVLGTFLASQYSDDYLTRFFIKDVLYEDCDTCRELIRHRWDAEHCEKILRHLCTSHIDDAAESSTDAVVSRIHTWMTRAFEVATRAGSSFGFFDLMACTPIDRTQRASDPLRSGSRPKNLLYYLERTILSEDFCDYLPGYYVAAMVWSQARGDKQIMQVVVRRGELSPGKTQFEYDPRSFEFLRSLTDGASSPKAAFNAAMNGRHSMAIKKLGTQEAGALTNKLMMVCRPWRIQGEDCARTQGDVVPDADAMRNERGECANAEFSLCRRHYGNLPDGSSPPDGFPIGVIAAQTIGERGTQLSMKAAKTGDVRSEKSDLARILGEGGRFVDTDDFKKLLAAGSDFAGYFPVHFVLLQEAIQRATLGKNSRNLAKAVAAQKKGNLFNLLAAGYKWEELADLIESHASSPAGGLNAEEMALRGQTKLPDFVPAPSPVARILIGIAGNTPENPSEGGNSFTVEPRDDETDDENGENTDDGFGFPSEDEEAEDIERAGEDDEKEDDEDVSDDEDDKKEGKEDTDDPADGRHGGIPTSRGRIALVMIHVGGERQFRPEIPDRSKWSASVSRLATHFATWAKTVKTLENAAAVKPLFNTQKDMLDAILEAAGKVAKKKDEKPMTGFMKRAFIYWEDRVLPVSALVGKVAEP